MEGNKEGSKPISARRQKILDKAFAQLRKSRAAMDPSLLKKIRRIIAGNPEIMKKLGVDETLAPDQDMPLSSKGAVKPLPSQTVKAEAATPTKAKSQIKQGNKNYEEVDQAKTMEVMAKFMTLNPDGRDKIKSIIDKAGK